MKSRVGPPHWVQDGGADCALTAAATLERTAKMTKDPKSRFGMRYSDAERGRKFLPLTVTSA